ncbi:hypothetical protein ACFQVC_12895 [Streptomyces monticola]|uniref:Phosphoenolpyruvate carboxylase n=1 Tax=Streptomyces monticola TaxID=2666263 RepID=A0ABW2JHE9_9ACTN
MTSDPSIPGPGTRLLTEQLGLADPLAELAAHHPPGEHLQRLARALGQTAVDLDAAYTRARQAGSILRDLRAQRDIRHLVDEIAAVAQELERELVRFDVIDTALIRLLAVYLDLTKETERTAAGGSPARREACRPA